MIWGYSLCHNTIDGSSIYNPTINYGNKAGKLLAQQLQEKVVKQNISHLFHPNLGKKLLNPQKIVDAFSSYYGKLYSLHRDKFTHQ